jgi:hypothetical protein
MVNPCLRKIYGTQKVPSDAKSQPGKGTETLWGRCRSGGSGERGGARTRKLGEGGKGLSRDHIIVMRPL